MPGTGQVTVYLEDRTFPLPLSRLFLSWTALFENVLFAGSVYSLRGNGALIDPQSASDGDVLYGVFSNVVVHLLFDGRLEKAIVIPSSRDPVSQLISVLERGYGGTFRAQSEQVLGQELSLFARSDLNVNPTI